jgi:hypothetical protein
MTIPDLNTPGVPQAAAHVFTWLADKVQGGANRAFGWSWGRGSRSQYLIAPRLRGA